MQVQFARAGNVTGLIVISFLLSRLCYEDRLPDFMHPIAAPRTVMSNQSVGHWSVALANRMSGKVVNAHQPRCIAVVHAGKAGQ
jgi:hypothetical protein